MPVGRLQYDFRGDGGSIDRRRGSVGKVRRHEHCVVIGHGQATIKRDGGSNFRQRGNNLPLGAGEDLGNGSSATAVRGGPRRVGLRSVSPLLAAPRFPVARVVPSGLCFSDAQPPLAEKGPSPNQYPARGGACRYGRSSLLPHSCDGRYAALSAADPKMADQCRRMAAFNGRSEGSPCPRQSGGQGFDTVRFLGRQSCVVCDSQPLVL